MPALNHAATRGVICAAAVLLSVVPGTAAEPASATAGVRCADFALLDQPAEQVNRDAQLRSSKPAMKGYRTMSRSGRFNVHSAADPLREVHQFTMTADRETNLYFAITAGLDVRLLGCSTAPELPTEAPVVLPVRDPAPDQPMVVIAEPVQQGGHAYSTSGWLSYVPVADAQGHTPDLLPTAPGAVVRRLDAFVSLGDASVRVQRAPDGCAKGCSLVAVLVVDLTMVKDRVRADVRLRQAVDLSNAPDVTVAAPPQVAGTVRIALAVAGSGRDYSVTQDLRAR